MSQQVDSQTVNLDDGESASVTLTWDTSNPDDIGDYIATAATEDDADTTSVTVENVTYHRFVEAVSPGGAASASRAGASDRSAVAAGTGAASVTRAVTAGRSLAATSRRGAGSVSRTSVTGRVTTAVSPGGSASIVRTVTVSSRRVNASGTGGAFVTRVGVLQRDVDAVSPGGDATVTRVSTADRFVTAVSPGGDAVISWSSPTSWQLPTGFESGRRVLITPESVSSDHDQLTLSTEMLSTRLDELGEYQSGGDVDRETGAYGTWRRIRRDAGEVLTVIPPTELSPPFDERRVVPSNISTSEISAYRHSIEITLGLEEPRAREPLEGGDVSIEADRESVSLGAGETASVSLSWVPGASDIGDWLATVSADTDSDSVLVSVSDADWTLAFPVATLPLQEDQIGQFVRGVDSGRPTLTIPLRLDASQAAVLFAVGSRVEATRLRAVPDGTNTIVDTLPDQELTLALATPDGAEADEGEYILREWSLARDRTGRFPFTGQITLLPTD